MKSHLEDKGYGLDPDTGIWRRPGYQGIPYNDGDAVESAIERILADAENVSLGSVELRRQCVDWPTLYHFSGTRANVVRPLESLFKGDVLEVGSGCGAITRYLGETGARVTALEGSLRRARITRLRTRDLANVTVIAENIKQFETTARFDVVTLIGVLEYANLFFGSATGCHELLERLSSLLKPGGCLVVAIENQLGLKYFSGGHEDHLAEAMVGLEDRYEPEGVRTFGRRALAELLADAGLVSVEFLYPFPDYKLSQAVITEAGFSDPVFDPLPLICGARDTHTRRDVPAAFFTNLVWPQILQNGLGGVMSNSFVAVASRGDVEAVEPGLLAVHYSTSRQPSLCKRADFRRTRDGVQVESHRLNGNQAAQTLSLEEGHVSHQLTPCERYHAGTLLSDQIHHCVSRAGWRLDELAAVFSAYLGHVDEVMAARRVACSSENVPGELMDLVPQNLIVDATGHAQPFDLEWVCDAPLPRAYLFFRAVFVSLCALVHTAPAAAGEPQSWRSITLELARRCGIELNERTYLVYLEREFAFQRAVSGLAPGSLLDAFDRVMPVKHRADQVLRGLPEGLDLAAERTAQRARIDALESALRTLESSASWRLTAPLRRLARHARHVQHRFFQLARTGLRRAHESLWIPAVLDSYIAQARQRRQFKWVPQTADEATLDGVLQIPADVPIAAERDRTDVFLWAEADWPVSSCRTRQLALGMAARGHRVFHVSAVVRAANRPGFDASRVEGTNRLYTLTVRLPSSADVKQGGLPSPTLTQLMATTRKVCDWAQSERRLSLVTHAGWGQVAVCWPDGVTVYDRVMRLHTASASSQLGALDRELMCLADLTVSSTELMAQDAETCARASLLLRDAADDQLLGVNPIDVVTHSTARKAIGCVGPVDDAFDIELIDRIAHRFPECDVYVFDEGCGDCSDAFLANPNVVYQSGISASETANQLQCVDVCIAPMRVTRNALTVSPTQLLTYLCLGKPVVATDLPEMQFYADVIDIAADHAAFLQALASCLSHPEDDGARARRVAFGREQRWSDRVSLLMSRVEVLQRPLVVAKASRSETALTQPPVCS
ncbi:MAG: methyltransferase [Pseudomonadota bacterium]